MGFLEAYPPLKRIRQTIPVEVLQSAPTLEELGINRLFFTTNSRERKLATSKNNVLVYDVKGISVYKMQNGTTYGVTQLRSKTPLSRFYSYLVELSSKEDIMDDIASCRGKLILSKEAEGKVVVYILKNDSQTIRVRIKSNVLDSTDEEE